MAHTQYVDKDDLKAYIGLTGTAQDNNIDTAIDSASRLIDSVCGRKFSQDDSVVVKTFTPKSSIYLDTLGALSLSRLSLNALFLSLDALDALDALVALDALDALAANSNMPQVLSLLFSFLFFFSHETSQDFVRLYKKSHLENHKEREERGRERRGEETARIG